ncbi:MAG TPA: hypothetical protein VGG41_20885 [Solirubrobacteraceae bacterium]
MALALAAIAPAGAGAASLQDVGGSASLETPVIVEASSDGGFDWGDAGIGAAGGVGLSMILVGSGLALSDRRGRRTGAHAQ